VYTRYVMLLNTGVT